jgi:translation elongation factor EF-1beta
MGHVVVKYKVTIDQPEDGTPDYDGIAEQIDGFEEVQAVEVKPLAFGMMFIEVQVVLGEGEGIVDGFENRVREINPLVGQIEALEMGRL